MSDGAGDPRRVQAQPEKRFFINMLVKDIELLPAVLDLVDNSVDGARRIRGDERYDDLHVELQVGPAEFRITDNCGGIDLDIARNYAFRFGRPEEAPTLAGSVGQFGVGMKRALFKLGTAFIIDSRTASTRFVLAVDVNEWANEPGSDWSFTLTDLDDPYDPASGTGIGTEIIVGPLHATVSEDFGSSQTLASLRNQLRLRHREAMERGLRMTLNGEPVTPFVPELLSSENVRPLYRTFDLDLDEGRVNVRIYAGAVRTDRANAPDDDEAEKILSEPESGWYVFCNNRLLIAADRTSLTGWGNGMNAYHPQYRQFRGYVYIDSDRSSLLPWNTTKTGVDQDSRVWRRIFSEMIQAGNEVVQMLNRAKTERQSAETEADQYLGRALAEARAVPLRNIQQSQRLSYPASPTPPPARNVRKIQYSVDRRRFDQVVEVLGTAIVAEVGRQTFDYFYSAQVGGDE